MPVAYSTRSRANRQTNRQTDEHSAQQDSRSCRGPHVVLVDYCAAYILAHIYIHTLPVPALLIRNRYAGTGWIPLLRRFLFQKFLCFKNVSFQKRVLRCRNYYRCPWNYQDEFLADLLVRMKWGGQCTYRLLVRFRLFFYDTYNGTANIYGTFFFAFFCCFNPFQGRSPGLGTGYLKFEWFASKTRLRF